MSFSSWHPANRGRNICFGFVRQQRYWLFSSSSTSTSTSIAHSTDYWDHAVGGYTRPWRNWTRGKDRGIHSQITWEGYMLETTLWHKFSWRCSILDGILPRYPSGSRIPVSNMCCCWTFGEEIASSCWPLVWAHSFGSTVLIHSLNHNNTYRARILHVGENLSIHKDATSLWATGNQRTWQNEAVYSNPKLSLVAAICHIILHLSAVDKNMEVYVGIKTSSTQDMIPDASVEE